MSTEHYIEPSDVNLGDRLAVQWTGHNGGWTTVDITDQESIDALDNANRIVFLEHPTALAHAASSPDRPCSSPPTTSSPQCR